MTQARRVMLLGCVRIVNRTDILGGFVPATGRTALRSAVRAGLVFGSDRRGPPTLLDPLLSPRSRRARASVSRFGYSLDSTHCGSGLGLSYSVRGSGRLRVFSRELANFVFRC